MYPNSQSATKVKINHVMVSLPSYKNFSGQKNFLIFRLGLSFSISSKTFIFQLSGLLSEKYVIKACLSHGKRIIPRNDDGYPYRKLSDQKSGKSRSWENRDRERISLLDRETSNRDFGEFDLDQDLDGLQDDTHEIEEAALCPGGRLLRLNVSATEQTPQ